MRRLRFSLLQLLVAVAVIAVILGVVDWYRQSSRAGETEVEFLRIAFSADGHTINVPAVADRYREGAEREILSGAVVILNAASGTTERTIGGFTEIPIAVSPDNTLLLTSKGDDLILRGFPTAIKCAVLQGRGQVLWAAFAPDGATMVTGGEDIAFRVWDLPTGQLRYTQMGSPLMADSYMPRLAYNHDGSSLAVAAGTLSVWETNGYRRTATLAVGDFCDLTFSADDALLAACGTKGVRVFDTGSWQAVTANTFDDNGMPAGSVVAVAAAPNDEFLAIADLSSKVWLADFKTGEPLGTISEKLTTSMIKSMAISPDGQLLAIGADDGHVWGFERVENPANGRGIKFVQRFVTPITLKDPPRIRWLLVVATGAVLLMCAVALRRARDQRSTDQFKEYRR
jgi:WD40 repeat protein